MRTTGFLTVLALVVLCGCASTPDLDYYTIDLTRSGGAASVSGVAVDRFVVAEGLDRRQIVIHSSPVRVEYYATARWATGIGEMVQAKLAAEFGPYGADPTLVVGGLVTAFEQIDTSSGPRARIALDVRIRSTGSKPGNAPVLAKTYDAERPTEGDSAEALARTLSRCLEDIAAEIAGDLAALGN